MRNQIVSVLYILWSFCGYAQICFEGIPLPVDSQVNIEEKVHIKQSALEKLRSEMKEIRTQLDLNNSQDQIKWLHLSKRYQELIALSEKSVQLNSTCSQEAETFFRCLALKTKYIEAEMNYHKQRAAADLSTSGGQRKWLAIGGQLHDTLVYIYAELTTCQSSQPRG
ncbi:MAG: hypothetical protein V4534_01365 [Myxococcota bacterium]